MSERIWYLKRCGLFERLTPVQLARLESRARFRNFERNEAIYLPGDQADGVLLLSTGRVRICDFTSGGKQAILAFIDPGELFGELALVDASPREERAEAVVASTVVLVPGDAFRELLDAVPGLSLGITRLFGLRRRRIERRLRSLLFRSNRERLVSLLLDLADQYGKPNSAGVVIDIRLSHQDLAGIIGSTRESVTIMLGELQREGLIRIARRTIVLTNLQRLCDGVDVDPERTRGLLDGAFKPGASAPNHGQNSAPTGRKM